MILIIQDYHLSKGLTISLPCHTILVITPSLPCARTIIVMVTPKRQQWYEDEPHIGYYIEDKKIKEKERQDKLDSFLADVDNAKGSQKVYDEIKVVCHKGAVALISVEASGQWMASGSSDGTVRISKVETGRCLRRWEVGQTVDCVAWNPLPNIHILATSVEPEVLALNTGLGG
ncbi:hypothetical protein VNO77_03157 [Canavalia gladiata]|uniref:BOP1 N-terminal domain-containing protein n=1 Tax=Canavalia gladiata TaxID=3824 RepID=A0AAN9MZD7_CANGL